jgi:hypothetical protein
MLRQLLFGSFVSFCNIAVHAFAMIVILRARGVVHANIPRHPSFRLVGIMIVIVSMLMAAHLMEIAIWSAAYSLVSATPHGADNMYFSFVNYTTLGYGDLVPVPRWRLLGPMTAMNGVLMFGWSTAVIFQVLWNTVSREDFSVRPQLTPENGPPYAAERNPGSAS